MRRADHDLAVDFKTRLREMLGERLLEVKAFGSRARGVHREDSDLDLLVVLDQADHPTRRAVAFLTGDMMIEVSSPPISALVMDPARIQELRRRERRLIREIDRDGIPI